MHSIVVGVDESGGAAEALRWAADERRLHDCSLTAVLCWTYLDQHQHEPDQPFDPTYGDDAAHRALDAILEEILAEEAANVERRVVNDHAARGLLEAAADADLLIVGARGLGGLRELTLGSTSQQCLHHATIPVAIVRDPAPPAAAGVVVGVDGSKASSSALQWALEEARRRQEPLTIVHAWTPPLVGGITVPAVAYGLEAFETGGRAVLDAAVEAADTAGLRFPVERRILCGAAGPVIVDVAAGASMVVVGSRGRGGFAGLLLGSVSRHVVHRASCPVVVIRHHD